MKDALSILQSYLHEAPVNIEGLIRELGIELDKKADLDESIAGQIERLKNGKYKISVNKDDHYYRQRFTMAHELGHYFFHRSLIGDGVNDSKAYRSTCEGQFCNANIKPSHETRANQFAASILMPEPLVCEIYKELKGDVAEIAKRFQASKQAMQIRIDSIDTLSPVETIVG